MLDAFAQHVDDAALGDLRVQAMQKLRPLRAVLIQSQGLSRLRLSRVHEHAQHRQVDNVLAAVVGVAAMDVARFIDERGQRSASPVVRSYRSASDILQQFYVSGSHFQRLRQRLGDFVGRHANGLSGVMQHIPQSCGFSLCRE